VPRETDLTLSREALYELVWSKLMVEISSPNVVRWIASTLPPGAAHRASVSSARTRGAGSKEMPQAQRPPPRRPPNYRPLLMPKRHRKALTEPSVGTGVNH
jgi:hypothetical protein